MASSSASSFGGSVCSGYGYDAGAELTFPMRSQEPGANWLGGHEVKTRGLHRGAIHKRNKRVEADLLGGDGAPSTLTIYNKKLDRFSRLLRQWGQTSLKALVQDGESVALINLVCSLSANGLRCAHHGHFRRGQLSGRSQALFTRQHYGPDRSDHSCRIDSGLAMPSVEAVARVGAVWVSASNS